MSDKLHSGHRDRIDRKADNFGVEFLEEHEQLERLLFMVLHRGDTNALAHRLLDEFGSLYGVVTADVERLEEVDGVGKRVARFLHDLLPMIGIVERSRMRENRREVRLDTIEKAGNYAKSLFNDKLVENLYMISLNSAMRVICFDRISEGTATATNVSLYHIAKLAIKNKAYAVVLAHNHPGGRLEPSTNDMFLTRQVNEALKSLGVRLAYHFVIARGEWRDIEF